MLTQASAGVSSCDDNVAERLLPNDGWKSNGIGFGCRPSGVDWAVRAALALTYDAVSIHPLFAGASMTLPQESL